MRGELPADWAEVADGGRSRRSPPRAKRWRRGRLRSRRSRRSRRICPSSSAAPRISRARTTRCTRARRRCRRDDPGGNYIYFGVREFGMSAILNGIAAHGGLIPYGGTFLVFSDYARNALRMAALIGLQSIFVLTHDSIGLGEDGPTHQPIEHLASLRLIPNMHVWRPCDAVETAVAWRAAIERRDGPTSLVLTRQDLPHVPRTDDQLEMIGRGGYILQSARRRAGAHADRDRLRSAARARRSARARAIRRCRSRRFDAVRRSIRTTERGLPRARAAADRRSARDRGRRHRWLVALCRRARQRDRASIASATRRRPNNFSSTSASRFPQSSRPPSACCNVSRSPRRFV